MSAEFAHLRDARRMGRADGDRSLRRDERSGVFCRGDRMLFSIRPLRLRQKHRELYDLLAEFYRQDTAGRFAGDGSG